MHYGGETWTQSSVHGDISTLKTYDSNFVYPPKGLAVFTVLESVQEVATVLLSCRTDHCPRVNRPKERCCCNARDRDLSYHGQRLGPGMTVTCPGIWKIPPLRCQCMPLSAVELKELRSLLSSSTPRTLWASAATDCRTKATSKLTVLKTTFCLLTPCNISFYLRPRVAWWWRSWLRDWATNLKVAGSILYHVTGIFHWHNTSGRPMALQSTQPLPELSTGVFLPV